MPEFNLLAKVNVVGTCIHIGDPCTDSYRDCDAGLICDKDANSGENYCKKPITGSNIIYFIVLMHIF